MNVARELKRQWKGETPPIAKWIRNIAGALTAVLPTAWYFLKETGIATPEWFEQSVGYMIFISAVITLAAGTKETKEAKRKRTGK